VSLSLYSPLGLDLILPKSPLLFGRDADAKGVVICLLLLLGIGIAAEAYD
jgi:hypothetical protein